MEKMLSPLQKPLTKHQKTTKKYKHQPPSPSPKVVYITNPIKFKTSASQFKALVQQLTGKHAEYAAGGVMAPVEDDVGTPVPPQVRGEKNAKMEELLPADLEGEEDGSDTRLAFGSGYDPFCSPEGIEDFQGMTVAGSNLVDFDAFQNMLCDNN